MTDDPLALDAETMRRLGYRAVDMLVDRLTDPSIPPLRRATPDEMAARLSGPPPDEPQDFDEILRRLDEDVLPFMSKGDHPGFFAFVPFAGTWPGALGDLIASATNVYAGSWMEAAGPSQLELEVLGWFKDWVGYPAEAAGILVSGGSAANLTALACAREALVGPMSDDLVVYVSDQAHSSVARAARILGFRQSQVRVIPSDDRAADARRPARVGDGRRPPRRPPAALRVRERRRDEQRRGRPAAGARRALPRARTSGSTSTRRTAASRCSPSAGGGSSPGSSSPTRSRSTRTSGSTSRTSAAACSSATGVQLRRAFEITPGLPARGRRARPRGQLLRPRPAAEPHGARVQGLGLDPVLRARRVPPRDRPRRSTSPSARERRIEASDRLELAARPSLGIVCFRRVFDEDEDLLNARLVAALEESGLGLVSSTRLKGRYTIRMCIMSHTTRRGGRRAGARLPRADRRRAETGRSAASVRAAPRRHAERDPAARAPTGRARFALLESLSDGGGRAGRRPRRAAARSRPARR